VSPVKYEIGFYISDDDILHSHCRDSLKSYESEIDCQYGNDCVRPSCWDLQNSTERARVRTCAWEPCEPHMPKCDGQLETGSCPVRTLQPRDPNFQLQICILISTWHPVHSVCTPISNRILPAEKKNRKHLGVRWFLRRER
jgi:hypothetical protein